MSISDEKLIDAMHDNMIEMRCDVRDFIQAVCQELLDARRANAEKDARIAELRNKLAIATDCIRLSAEARQLNEAAILEEFTRATSMKDARIAELEVRNIENENTVKYWKEQYNISGRIHDRVVSELRSQINDLKLQLDIDQAEEREVMGCTKEELVALRNRVSALERVNSDQEHALDQI